MQAFLFLVLGLSSAQIIKTNNDLVDIEKINEIQQVNEVQEINENEIEIAPEEVISPIKLEEIKEQTGKDLHYSWRWEEYFYKDVIDFYRTSISYTSFNHHLYEHDIAIPIQEGDDIVIKTFNGSNTYYFLIEDIEYSSGSDVDYYLYTGDSEEEDYLKFNLYGATSFGLEPTSSDPIGYPQTMEIFVSSDLLGTFSRDNSRPTAYYYDSSGNIANDLNKTFSTAFHIHNTRIREMSYIYLDYWSLIQPVLFYYNELCQIHRPERTQVSFERLKVYSGLNRSGTLLYDYRWGWNRWVKINKISRRWFCWNYR